MFGSRDYSISDCPPPLIIGTATAKWKCAGIEEAPNCPRCASTNTKFCYYNNYSLSQPRYLCKACRRYWTKGGSLRNVPVGGGSRKGRRARTAPKCDLIPESPCVDPAAGAEESSGSRSSDNRSKGMAVPVDLGSGGDCDPRAMVDGQDLGGFDRLQREAICDQVGPGDLWSDDCGPQLQPTMQVQDFRSISPDDQFGFFDNLAVDNNWTEIFSNP